MRRAGVLGGLLVVLLGCTAPDRDACERRFWLGCSHAYRAGSQGSGLSTGRIGPGSFWISYEGPHAMSRETLQTYWLYSAADLTLSIGHAGFEVISTSMHLADALPAEPVLRRVKDSKKADEAQRRTWREVERMQRKRERERFWQDRPPPPPALLYGIIRVLMPPLEPAPPKTFDAAKLKAALEPHVMGALCANGSVCPHSHDYLRPSDREGASSQPDERS